MLALGLHLEIEHPALGFLVLGLGLAQADLELLHRGARRIELGLGLGERQLVGLRIEAHEHLALRDRGMVANRELGDAALHLAGDLGDVGLHVGVLGRGVAPALQPERQRGKDDERRHRDEQDRPHVAAPVDPEREHAWSEQPQGSHRHGTTSSSSAPASLTTGLLRMRIGVSVAVLRLGLRGGVVGDVDEPRLDAAQQLEELPGLALRQLGQRVVDGCLGNAPDALVHALRLGREVDAIDSPVAGLGAALDPALGLEAVDQPADGRLLDLHHVGKLGLGGARPPVQAGQRQPLRACEAEPAHAPVEHRAHQPRNVGDHEAEMVVGIRHAAVYTLASR